MADPKVSWQCGAVRRVLGVAVLLLLLAPAGASAAAFLPPHTAHVAVSADDFKLVVNDRGDGIAVWREIDTGDPSTGADDKAVIRYATRSPGGRFTDAGVISANTASGATKPDVAIDPDGSAVVVYTEGSPARVAYRIRNGAGGPWSAANFLSATSSAAASTPDVELRNGRVAVIWVSGANQPLGTYGTLTGGLGTNTPLDVSSGTVKDPTVAITPAGDAVYVWARQLSDRTLVQSTRHPFDTSAFSSVDVLSVNAANRHAVTPDLAVDPSGQATVAFFSQSDAAVEYAVRSAPGGRVGAGAWSSSARVSPPDQTAELFPEIAATPDGTVAAAYWGCCGSRITEHTAVKPPGLGFGTFQTVSGDGVAVEDHEIAADKYGNVMVAYGTDPGLQTALRAAGSSSFLPLKSNVIPTREPYNSFDFNVRDIGLAYDGEGNAFVGALMNDQGASGQRGDVQFATYDAAAPVLSATSIPGSAAIGVPVGFSSSATDSVSAVSLSWDFGDGTGAAGESVSHTYAAGGTYTVRVTATDQAGNASSSTGTVEVPAAPQQPPPNPPAGPARISAAASGSWKVHGSYTTVKKLVVKTIPAGASIYVKCSGGRKLGCPFNKTKKFKFKKATKSKDLTSLFKPRRKLAKLKAKARVEVGVSAPAVLGNFTTWTFQKKKKSPKKTTGCLAVGSTKKTTC